MTVKTGTPIYSQHLSHWPVKCNDNECCSSHSFERFSIEGIDLISPSGTKKNALIVQLFQGKTKSCVWKSARVVQLNVVLLN